MAEESLKDILDKVDQLRNQNVDLGGGPGIDNARAISQLIMGGGGASLEGVPLFGGGVNPGGDLGSGRLFNTTNGQNIAQLSPTAPRPAVEGPLKPSLQKVLDSADQIATSLSGGSRGTVMKTLLPNPYGPGSFDPSDPEAVSAVRAQGAKYAETQRAKDTIKALSTTDNPLLKGAAGQQIVGRLLQAMGLQQSDEQKAYEHTRGVERAKAEAAKADAQDIEPMAKMLAEKRLGISDLARLPAAQKMAILNRAAQLDPNLNTNDVKVKLALQKEFMVGGKAAQNIDKLNTAVDHLEKFKLAGEALQNGDVQLLNKIKNGIGKATGDKRITKFQAAAEAVAGEMAQVFKGTGGTDVEIEKWKKLLNDADSPEQIQGVFDQMVNLMRGRVDALDYRYSTANDGKPHPGIFSPKAKGIIKRLGVDIGSNSQARPLDRATAQAYKDKAGGDLNKARQLAKDDGFEF